MYLSVCLLFSVFLFPYLPNASPLLVSYIIIWFSDLKDEEKIIYDVSTDDEAGGDPPELPKQHVRCQGVHYIVCIFYIEHSIKFDNLTDTQLPISLSDPDPFTINADPDPKKLINADPDPGQ